MSCPDKKGLITRYVSGVLSGEAKTGFENHLLGCPSCRIELSLAQSLEEALKSQPYVAAPPDFLGNVMNAIDWFEKQSLEYSISKLIRYRRRLSLWEDVLRVGMFSSAVAVFAWLFVPWYHNLTQALSQFSRQDVLHTFLLFTGVRNGGVNITYVNPVLTVCAVAFGLWHAFPRFRPLRVSELIPLFRLW